MAERDVILNDINNITIEQLTQLIKNGTIKKTDIWQDLLRILKNENDDTELGHYFFRQGTPSDFVLDSLIDRVQSQADMNEECFDELLNTLRDEHHQGVNFWNESMSNAIRYYLKHMELNEMSEVIPGTNGNMSYWDIVHADAGYDFTSDETIPYVVPWINIDSNDYIEVRAGDEIKAVLEDASNLQFTHTQASKWIRLIMPEYERYVEIEDLDRNFWVIGQVITAISAYLFDEDSPIKSMIEKLLQELTELWENILYLWAALALYDKREYTDVHVEACYVPNDTQQTQFKYDNFDRETSWIDLCNLFKYKIAEYPESNLIIIPIRRMGNYEHNYYTKERYPGILFYDRNQPYNNASTNGFRILSFQNPQPVDNKYLETCEFTVDECKTAVYGAKVVQEGVLDVKFPFSNISTQSEINRTSYYGAIRTIPLFTASDWSYTVDDGFIFKGFQANGYDAIADAIGSTNTSPVIIKSITGQSISIRNAARAEDDGRIRIALNSQPFSKTGTDNPSAAIVKGYYMGELVTERVSTKEIEYSINERSISLPPITSTDNREGYNGKVYYYDIKHAEDNIAQANIDTLKLVKKYVYNQSATKIELLIGTRKFDLFRANLSSSATSQEKADLVVRATGRNGLGAYYAKVNGKNMLYKRGGGQDSEGNSYESYTGRNLDESGDSTHYFSETIDANSNYQNNLNFNGALDGGPNNYKNNPYILPLCIYSTIDISDYDFVTKNKTPNAYQAEDGTTMANIYDTTDTTKRIRFTGSHAARSDLGAILRIPGIGDVVYDDYENFRITPPALKTTASSNDVGAYALYVNGDFNQPERHTWNNMTVMRFIKEGQTVYKSDNWCIIYIQTYGVYAPNAFTPMEDNYIKGADSIKAHRSTGEGPYQTETTERPMAFKTKVHVFLPNGKYESYTHEMYYCRNINSRPTDEDDFVWSASHAATQSSGFSAYADLINLAEGSSANNYTKEKQYGNYTGYTLTNSEYVRSSKELTGSEVYNFYKYPRTGKA